MNGIGVLLAAAFAVLPVVAFMDASVQSNGDYISSWFNAPLSTTMPGLMAPILFKTPTRLLGSALLIALGRSLHEAPPPADARLPD